MQEVFETAPAKVNLALHVTGQRADGYHDLESLVVFAELSDELRAVKAKQDRLFLKGPFAASLTNGHSNLVLKAVSAFREYWPNAVPHGIEIELTKNLPVAAGIGGGSADAAASLRLMVRFSQQSIAPEPLADLAQKLGADVPVCLQSQPCIVRGIGEIVRPLDLFPACHMVLINPLIPVTTADIFRRMTKRQNPPLPDTGTGFDRAAMLGFWLQETRNDLQQAAMEVAPIVGEIIARAANTKGCIAARMSGSGATVFSLYGASAEAHQAAHDLREKWPDFWIAAAPVQCTR